nr:hypothetical protein CPGR_00582 [Mycolicibacter nonchromogenicus]
MLGSPPVWVAHSGAPSPRKTGLKSSWWKSMMLTMPYLARICTVWLIEAR